MKRFEFTAELSNVIEDSFPDEQDLADLSEDDVQEVQHQLEACCDQTLEIIKRQAARTKP